MNEQPLQRWEWTGVVEDLKIRINNTTIQLELLNVQLKEAEAHAQGK